MTETPTPRNGIELFPIAIGAYAHKRYERLDVDSAVRELGEALGAFGPTVVPWDVAMNDRDLSAVTDRLTAWSSGAHANGEFHNTMLYWVGHGWSKRDKATLAHCKSPYPAKTGSLLPVMLAEFLSEREAAPANDSWAIVVIEACHSKRFVELVSAELDSLGDAKRILLVATSEDGATRLGVFTTAFRECLKIYFPSDPQIELWALAKQLGKLRMLVRPTGLYNEHLIRVPPVPTPVTLDARDELKEILDALPAEERHHYIAKAQGAELGESLWFFEGREEERLAIVRWLAGNDTGLLVVTGEPGTGKSAFLGNVLALSRPDLREVLVRRGFQRDLTEEERPPDDVFNVAMLLTGATVDTVIARIGKALGMGEPPAADVSTRIDWLLRSIRSRFESLTLLLDGLDEAQQPVAIARSLLSRLATTEGVRLIIGTRRRTDRSDLPDPVGSDLLGALVELVPPQHEPIVIGKDESAVRRYVQRRLEKLLEGSRVDGSTIAERIADHIERLSPEFLYARLAVHELHARRSLLEEGNAAELAEVVNGDQEHLYRSALERLTVLSPSNRPLLEALAHGLGRGLPSRDTVWTAVATALSPNGPVAESELTALYKHAAPYLMLDAEADYSVYRLAHQTFQRLLLGDHTDENSREKNRRIADALLRVAGETPAEEPMNPYIARYLSGHVARAGVDVWWELAKHRTVLDRLDPQAVTADAFRTLFGRVTMPPEIAGLMGTRHLMSAVTAGDRRGLREIGMARYAGVDVPRPPKTQDPISMWSLGWAHIVPRPTHMTLQGHKGPVEDVALSSDGRIISASVDGTIRIWDVATGTRLNILSGHSGAVRSIAVAADGKIISGGDDRTVVIWDSHSGNVVTRLVDHTGPVRSVAALGDGRIASASDDNTIRLWDVSTGASTTLRGHVGPVAAVIASPDGQRIVSAGVDGTIRAWSEVGVELARVESDSGPVSSLALSNDGLIVAGGEDGSVRWWHPESNEQGGLTRHQGPVYSVALAPDGSIISTGADAMIRVWSHDGVQLNQLDGHDRGVLAVTVTADGQIISGGVDGTVRVWDAATSTHVTLPGHAGLVEAIAVTADGERIAYGGHDGVLRTSDAGAGTLLPAMRGHNGAVLAIAASPDQKFLVSGGEDRTIRVWTLDRSRAPSSLNGHTGAIRALAVARDGLIVSAGDDHTVRVWRDGSHLTRLTGNAAPIHAVAVTAAGLIVSGDDDGSVRIWDATAGTYRERPGHQAAVRSLAVMADDRIVSGGDDGTVRIWETVEEAHQSLAHGTTGAPVRAVTVTADGRIVSGGDDGILRVWRAMPGVGWESRDIPVGTPIRAVATVGQVVIVAGNEGVLALRMRLGTPGRQPDTA